MTHPPTRSPIAMRIHAGEELIAHAIATGRCYLPSCLGEGGQHQPGCWVGLALRHDPSVRRRLMAPGEEGNRG